MVFIHSIKRGTFIKLFIITLSLVLVLCVVLWLSPRKDEVYQTTDIDEYNAEYVLKDKTVFLGKIPACAVVESFSYYKYFSDRTDTFLVLKFPSEEELQKYCSDIITNAKMIYSENLSDEDIEIYICELSNPYDNSFNDVYFVYSGWMDMRSGKSFVGYKYDDHEYYECNIKFISYSLESLTVVQSATRGWFEAEEYLPRFFDYFKIELSKGDSRYIYEK